MKTDQYDELIKSTDWLAERDLPVAITITELLEPASGPTSVIFPPTYARRGGDHPYSISVFRADIPPEDAAAKGLAANACDLDSVGAQGNRMEPEFARPPLNELVPQITITHDRATVNLLEIGHRVADGAVRFSKFGPEAAATIAALEKDHNALPLAQLAPTSLVFGFWDSRGSQLKYPRVVASTIRATNVGTLKRSAQFNPAFDPANLAKSFAAEMDLPEGGDEKNPLSQEGLLDAPSVDTHGGVRVFGEIERRTEINLVSLRAIAAARDGSIDETETRKLRRYLLGLSLIAAQVQSVYNLRQGCLLVQKPKSERTMQLVYPSGKRDSFNCDLKDAHEFAKAAAKEFFGEPPPSRAFAFERTKVAAALATKSGEKAERAAKKARKKKGETAPAENEPTQ